MSDDVNLSGRVLILAPAGREASLAASGSTVCHIVEAFCAELEKGAALTSRAQLEAQFGFLRDVAANPRLMGSMPAIYQSTCHYGNMSKSVGRTAPQLRLSYTQS